MSKVCVSKKINNRGFSFAEVLAVLIILAVILALTVPKVISVIDESRKGVVKTNVLNYLNTLQLETKERLEEEDIKEDKYIVKPEGKYLSDGKEFTIHAKGELPTGGIVCIDKKGTVGSYSLAMNGYVVNNVIGTEEIVKGDTTLNITCDVTREIVEIKTLDNVCTKTKTIEIIYPKLYLIANEYRINNGDWKEYTNPIELKENATIYARLRDTRNNEVSDTANIVIKKIDNEKVSTESPVAVLSAEHPTNQIIASLRQKDTCGIDTSTIEYGISDVENGEYKYYKETTFNRLFTGLKNNTTYYIKTRANDIANNGVVESEVTSITTGEFEEIKIKTDSKDWKSSKEVTISAKETPGATLEYIIKHESKPEAKWDIYTGKKTINWDSNKETPTVIYARFNDGVNTSKEASYTETHIDTQAPICGSFNGESTTWTNGNRTISLECTDKYSGCKSPIHSMTYTTDTKVAALSFTLEDNAGNTRTCSGNVNVYVDKSGPSKPTIALKLDSNTGSGYSSGSWTAKDVWHIVNSSDSGAGVSYYQYSHDNNSWSNDINTLGWNSSYANGKNTLSYRINWSGQWNFFVRAVDALGNVSESSDMFTVRIDKTAPTVSYNYKGGIYTSKLAVTVTGSDTNFDHLNVEVKKDGNKQSLKSNDSIDKSTFEVNLDSDGEWIIISKAYDKAGNVSAEYTQKYIIEENPYVSYYAYVAGPSRRSGNQGSVAGTVGESKQIEKIEISVKSKIAGDINYQAHIQDDGYTSEVTSGTIGKETKRMEAIRIRLTGDLANYFDVYYRVHVQNKGWLSIAKNGQWTGSSGLCLRMEAIEIILVRKDPETQESETPDLTALPGKDGKVIQTNELEVSSGSVCSSASRGPNNDCDSTTKTQSYSCKKTVLTNSNGFRITQSQCRDIYGGNCIYNSGAYDCTCEYTSTCTKSYDVCK